MAITDIGSITRIQDFSIIKHNEDMKPALDQAIAGLEMQKHSVAQSEEVVEADTSDWYRRREDASEKGDNEYAGDGGAHRRDPHEKQKPADQVVVKGRPGGFDIKI